MAATYRNATLGGGCPTPFYDASMFPLTGGYVGGRFCAPSAPGAPYCCLPCPASQWVYADNFNTIDTGAGWVNVVGLIVLSLLLLSYIVLPVQYTRSHYLSVCLIIGTMMINIGFVIPLGVNPDQCYNEITPNDMYSSLTCAWSGAFILSGALVAVSWIFIRGLSMHLQICWDIVPGRKFFYWAQFLGWATPAAIFTASMTASGVSFRFGEACHINHDKSMASFWGWLIAVSAAATILQVATVGYCINVYLRNLFDDNNDVDSEDSQGQPRTQYQGSLRTQTARGVFVRLKKVLVMQWRGMMIVTNLLFDVIFFTIVFVYLDDYSANVEKNYVRAEPWLMCLIENGGNKTPCLSLGAKWLVSENILASVLFILSLASVEVFVLLFRASIITGWIEFFNRRFNRKQEFVSLDAVHRGNPSQQPWSPQSATLAPQAGNSDHSMKSPMTMYEMQRRHQAVNALSNSTPTTTATKEYGSPTTVKELPSPEDAYASPFHYGRSTPEPLGAAGTPADYFTGSVVGPDPTSRGVTRTPSTGERTVQSMGWDPVSSYAGYGATQHQPIYEDHMGSTTVAERERQELQRARGNAIYR